MCSPIAVSKLILLERLPVGKTYQRLFAAVVFVKRPVGSSATSVSFIPRACQAHGAVCSASSTVAVLWISGDQVEGFWCWRVGQPLRRAFAFGDVWLAP
jgi:hypothetical protein